ncbi:MAG: nucleotide sugar dehydrogenase [Clostridiales bacterium]|jgi:UDP-N-acetyl-D-glucosamine dehydrogenase|nr:nucleotide sugar dehydrogenase [Eubacteriales bacterium]MDH7566162.1 nucleotide sugar dehydrogenase [Clostridiales bacterium]
MSEVLLQKILNKTAVIGVVGLGYVGLPLAVEKAKAGYKVIGFDVQKEKVRKVNEGINYIGDIVDSDLKEVVARKKLTATSDFSFVKNVDCVTICVPTPLDRYYQPDISYVVKSARDIARHLHREMLVILESTTYPGTTEEVLKPIFEKTGLVCGRDFYLAFSPERVDPGNKLYGTKNTPKVVGGVGEESTRIAAALYRSVLESEVYEVSSPAVAEMEKILENTFRNINIALANEMAILCDRMKINVWEVINAAKSKPYGFMAFYPGPGVGGHCIPIDPFYLTWKAREYGYHTRLIETAGEINNYMPEFITQRSMSILNRFKKPMNGSKILLLGVAYKQDIDDIRESPALKVLDCLEREGAVVSYADPHIPKFRRHGKTYTSVLLDKDSISAADLLILTTMHTKFDYELIAANAKMIFDTKNAFSNIRERSNIEVL